MLYIVRVYVDGETYECERGIYEHAEEQLKSEYCCAELYCYENGQERPLRTNNDKYIKEDQAMDNNNVPHVLGLPVSLEDGRRLHAFYLRLPQHGGGTRYGVCLAHVCPEVFEKPGSLPIPCDHYYHVVEYKHRRRAENYAITLQIIINQHLLDMRDAEREATVANAL